MRLPTRSCCYQLAISTSGGNAISEHQKPGLPDALLSWFTIKNPTGIPASNDTCKAVKRLEKADSNTVRGVFYGVVQI